MRVVLISFITPFKVNLRGTSALSYHLLKGRSCDIDVILYTFNNNKLTKEQITEVAKRLGVEIRLLEIPLWYRWMFKLHLLPLRVFLKYPFLNYITLPQRVVEEIRALHPDLIWVNNEEMSRIVMQFPGIQRMQLGPDVESLYYYRMMGKRFVMDNLVEYWKCAIMYRKYARLELHLCNDFNFTYYAVGEGDIEHLRQLNPLVNCKLLRHPHYDVKDDCEIHFHHPKIKLLIAGRYDLYMKQTADELFPLLASQNLVLKDDYEITFLGKGWDKHVAILQQAGFKVEHIYFAPNYIEEITKHDIQLTPICVGTGTKGKVLDALANGLLVLGTYYALENIAVDHGKSCVLWEQACEVPGILLDIAENREKYEQMAKNGREAVLSKHNPLIISQQLFSLID